MADLLLSSPIERFVNFSCSSKNCEDAIEIRKCTSTKISGFVNSSFNTNIFKELGLSGRQRLSVMFKIDIDGSIKSIRVRTAHKKLEEEAIRVVKLLPKMKPGSHNGEKVTVPYTLPIIKMVFYNHFWLLKYIIQLVYIFRFNA